MRYVPDEVVQELLNEIDEATEAHAPALALRWYMQERRKVLKSQLMNVADAEGLKSEFRQERFAYSHPQYLAHLEQTRAAIEDEARKAGKVKLAEANWEAWRSLNANTRGARGP